MCPAQAGAVLIGLAVIAIWCQPGMSFCPGLSTRASSARGSLANMTAHRRRRGAYPGRMGRIILTLLGAILAIGLVFTAIGWIFAMLKTFLIIALIAVVVFIVVSLLAKRRRRD
jgi:Flp pilus assembly protein TadB